MVTSIFLVMMIICEIVNTYWQKEIEMAIKI
jgi:hypothetical protein